MFDALKRWTQMPSAAAPSEGSPFTHLNQAGQQAAEHVDALAQLFSVELQEYKEQQFRRMFWLAAAVVPAAAAYLLLCALGVYLLQQQWGWAWALGALCLFNGAAAVVGVVMGSRYGRAPFAPLTLREIKNDWQCIKLLISSNRKA